MISGLGEVRMKLLVTGSNGLIGGEAVGYFDAQGHTVIGADNNMRREFFGAGGDTLWNLQRISRATKHYLPTVTDIRSKAQVQALFDTYGPFDAIIHCAAQPSHDKARDIPLLDFEVNAVGTLNLLEQARQSCPESVFIFTSTNKVYGDAPNEMPLLELDTRWEYADPKDYNGVTEQMRIDQTTHSLFGVSKVAADLMVQEYGRYFGMKTCVFRGGCLTGPGHSGVELHGFLSYLARMVVTGGHYKIYGYKGKQVRDNIHSNDVVQAMEQVILTPRQGEVYNMGGGRGNSVSMLEAISKLEMITGKKLSWEYVDAPRVGDHICYISDLTKFRSHYPSWNLTKSLDETLVEIWEGWQCGNPLPIGGV
jgi:CDP-paratose 2-epimerase